MSTTDFLLEIGTEELPPKALEKLALSLFSAIKKECNAAHLDFDTSTSNYYASPRRLAVLIGQLSWQQPLQTIYRKGPAISAAYDEQGKPSKALEGFLRSCHTTLDKTQIEKTDKGEWVVFKGEQAGKTATELLPAMIQTAVKTLPIPKPMRWGNFATEFIRPVHWVVALLGKQVLPLELLGKTADRITYGHRFLKPDAIKLKAPSNYENALEKAKVIACFAKRQQLIQTQIDRICREQDAHAKVDLSLLDEVTALVEWPTALLGNIDQNFLSVPKEILIITMESHQKSFALEDAKGNLLPKFITISNIESKQPEQVIFGNEKVMRARLADAKFFFEQDKKIPLTDRLPKLTSIIFQKQLGTQSDRVERIKQLSLELAALWNVNDELAARAAQLCKADLLTDVVGEFPSLQGLMGRYYALNDGEDASVATAIGEHYQPRFSDDAIPASLTGAIVSLADKIDTLVGIFGINQAPTGDKDPFALRRAAIGIIRIILEKNLSLDLNHCLQSAVNHYQCTLPNKQLVTEIKQFIFTRLEAWYASHDVNPKIFQAVYYKQSNQLLDFEQRIKAVLIFLETPQAQTLIASNKRVVNILSKSGVELNNPSELPNKGSLVEPQEKALWENIQAIIPEVETLFDEKNYEQALKKLTELAYPIDAFFDHVMVMTDDKNLRHTRLLLLNQLRILFSHVADIARLPHEK